MARTSSRLRSTYVCPQPTNMIGAPEEYAMDRTAPTLLSMASNLDTRIPSISRASVPSGDKSARRWLNLMSWFTPVPSPAFESSPLSCTDLKYETAHRIAETYMLTSAHLSRAV
jgi:hypothetical protein